MDIIEGNYRQVSGSITTKENLFVVTVTERQRDSNGLIVDGSEHVVFEVTGLPTRERATDVLREILTQMQMQ